MPKITSLSEQLKNLQVPQTNFLNIVQDRRRVSFLYDPKEAANLDSEDVYCVAMNGLEQLKSIDQDTFEPFELTLFNQASITFERAIQTKQINEKLNNEIRQFLIHLSPYFMLKPAHKVFEWLIYRYQIHTYNINEIFMCILPYHETNYFVRALQLINLDSSNQFNKLWLWLLENQKKGVHLAPATLATYVFSDLSFFNFLIDYLKACLGTFDLSNENATKSWINGVNFVISFFTKTMLQSIKQLSVIKSRKNANNKQQESFFSQLFPVLFEGFKSDVVAFKQSSYLICSYLFEKFQFSSESCHKALFAICKGLSSFSLDNDLINKTVTKQPESIECIKSSILTICLIIQSHENQEADPIKNSFLKKLLKNLSRSAYLNQLFVDTIDNLNETYRIDKFLGIFLTHLVTEVIDFDKENQSQLLSQLNLDLDANNEENELSKIDGKNDCFNLVMGLLNKLNLNRTPEIVNLLVHNLFDCLCKKQSVANLLVEYHLCELIHKFENKYPTQFDLSLNKYINKMNSSENQLDKNQINYLLNTISVKFSRFRCKSSFKYQSVNNDLNLITSLNHANESIRANALTYILNQIDKANNSSLDQEFIKEQLEARIKNESSPLVYKKVLNFGAKLLNYFSFSDLLSDGYLFRLFSVEVLDRQSDEENQKINIHKSNENYDWSECREACLDLIFTDFYKNEINKKDLDTDKCKQLFFNYFLIVSSYLFELSSTSLIDKLKSTNFYSELHSDSHNDTLNGDSSPVKKKFYSTSSISIIKKSTGAVISSANGKTDTENQALDDAFENFLQVSVKFMLSNVNKINNNHIIPPVCFDKLKVRLENTSENSSAQIRLLDLIVFELSVRVCMQSLFMLNSSYYLNIGTYFLIKLCASSNKTHSLFNLKVKKSKSLINGETSESDTASTNKKQNTFSNFWQMIMKGSIKNVTLLQQLYSNLFRSFSTQLSNFVNKNRKNEIDDLLKRLYVYLCSSLNEYRANYFDEILNNFMYSNIFNLCQTDSATPTKITASSSSRGISAFFKFAFKFIFHTPESQADLAEVTQFNTIGLFNSNLKLIVENRAEEKLVNCLVLITTWSLTSSSPRVRARSLDLLESLQSNINEGSSKRVRMWSNYLKKLLKHRKEIELDGDNYVRTKSINRIFSSCLTDADNDETSILLEIQDLLLLKSNKLISDIYQYLESEPTSLITFKICLVDLLKNMKDELKLKLSESIFNLLLNTLNMIIDDSNISDAELELHKKLINLIVNNYLLTGASSGFFNNNEKYFDYLIGYLNNTDETHAGRLIRYLKSSFITKLLESNAESRFFENLNKKMQLDLLKCCFEMCLFHISIKSNEFEANIRGSIIQFNLKSSHFIYLLNEILPTSSTEVSTANTTKEMKKQLIASTNTEQEEINLSKLKLVLELTQSSLVQKETLSSDDLDESCIELIPHIFNVLNLAETSLMKLIPTPKKSIKSGEEEMEVDEEEEDTNEKENIYLNIEAMCLNSLLSIYKLNKSGPNKSKLDQSNFKIELLMQILQTVNKEDSTEEQISQDVDNSILRLNIKEQILVLLSEISSIFPDKVLEHVLIMFVFVGNKLARKDDLYSFQIISKIIQTILPSIVSGREEENSEASQEQAATSNSSNRLIKTVNVIQRHQKQLPYVSSLVCKILQSFVVSLPHIPAHRKTVIFSQLLEIIGLNDYLWITIIQSVDYYLVQSNDLLDFTNSLEQLTTKQQKILANNDTDSVELLQQQQKNEKKLRDILKSCIQSMISLHSQFEPTKVIKSTTYLVTFLNKYLSSLFDKAVKLANSKVPNAAKQQSLQNKQIYSHLACQLDNYNLLQMKYLAYNLLAFVGDLLISEELVTKLSVIYEKIQVGDDDEYSQLFQNLLEKILVLILKLSQIFSSFEQQINKNASSHAQTIIIEDLKKFHKAILNKSYDLMEKTINLLDSKQFIIVIQRLIKHEDDSLQIRRRVLALLNNKLRKHEPSEQETTLLISIIDDLLSCIQLNFVGTNGHVQSKESFVDIEINNQTILFSIKLLCKRIGEQNPLAFVKVIKYLSDHLIDRKIYIGEKQQVRNSNLLSSVLLCIGEVCLKLKSNSLVYLNQIMMFTMEIVDLISKKISETVNHSENELLIEEKASAGQQSSVFKNNQLLILSCVTCLLKIVQNMSVFLSPYLNRLFFISCSLSYLLEVSNVPSQSPTLTTNNQTDDLDLNQNLINKSNLTQLELKLTQLRSTLATLIPLRLLAPILSDQSYNMIAMKDNSHKEYTIKLKHIEFCMQIARIAVKNANQEETQANIRILRTIFMNLFDLRTSYVQLNKSKVEVNESMKKSARKQAISTDSFITEELSKYENYVINAFCELTFKLSEDLFRPIFFKMYEWAVASIDSGKDRLITFYRSTFKLSDKLKNLFVLFAPQFVQNAAEILNQLNSSKTDEKYFESASYKREQVLLNCVIDTLSNVFVNDTQRTFINKERFNLLMEPLVDQIENEVNFVEDYKSYINDHLAPCIGNLASCCVHDDTLCRKFNYQILLKTKHSSVQVRLATLDVLNIFAKKVGDIYNSYLSETVPFLAELMEDPVEEVEDKVQFLIKELEDILGESIQSHFV